MRKYGPHIPAGPVSVRHEEIRQGIRSQYAIHPMISDFLRTIQISENIRLGPTKHPQRPTDDRDILLPK